MKQQELSICSDQTRMRVRERYFTTSDETTVELKTTLLDLEIHLNPDKLEELIDWLKERQQAIKTKRSQ